ncbi:MAG: transglutaminase family protein [Bacteroidetes bacterium]|nr:transglutaminase family protein [Bacteroidota bacterium]
MPRFKIHHITKYTYEAPVRDSANQIILFPIRDEYQDVVKQEIHISNEPEIETYKDYYGNEIGSFMYAEPHTEMLIDSKVEVITRVRPSPKDSMPADEQWKQMKALRFQVPFIDFLNQEQFSSLQDVVRVLEEQQCKNCTPLEATKKMAAFVFSNFKYIKGITDVETTLDEVWKLKAGVCQDFAHMLLVMLRITNIPARYVSGYVCPNKNDMRGEGATHAWVEAYIPFYGWLGIDPTNNCLANDLHVRLAVGRNFSDCSPVKGTFKGISGQQLEVGVSVTYEDGRSTEEENILLKAQPSKNPTGENSYRRYMEMMQQQ